MARAAVVTTVVNDPSLQDVERSFRMKSPVKHLENPTRILFFTGKGGVGKTSLACATAVHLADQGRRVLLVSTDPASNLDEVLQVSLTNHPTPVPKVPGLFAMNLDPEASAAEYRERMVGPYRNLLPRDAIVRMEEQFSGSCTLEIAAFDEFSRLLGDQDATAGFEHLIFDTAPTGHTLRLLALPSAWTTFIETNTTGTSCLGPLAGLREQQQLYQQTVTALSDAATTTVVLVSRPEESALREAARTSAELADLGVVNQRLIMNGVFQATDLTDPLAVAMQQRAEVAMKNIPVALHQLPCTTIPLLANGLLGIDSLRNLGQPPLDMEELSSNRATPESNLSFSSLVDRLASPGQGVILTMGKGGVGKTTIAAAVAMALADRGHQVHLSTTDPAAHIAATIAADAVPNLTVSRIDPVAETQRYSSEVMKSAGRDLEVSGRDLLAEDLRSPCTEEIAVFQAFAQAIAEGTDRFVVLDTAPTGHTILLLDAAMAYHREVNRQSTRMPDPVVNLLPRLRDSNFTRILIVTLPEATPVHEAESLQRDLRRAGIEPFAWVINQTLARLTLTDAILCKRQAHEVAYIREVTDRHSRNTVLLPWKPQPPVGPEALRDLISDHDQPQQRKPIP